MPIVAPDRFAVEAGALREPIKPDAGAIAWATPFARRFPNRQLVSLLAQLWSHGVLYIGGLPPP